MSKQFLLFMFLFFISINNVKAYNADDIPDMIELCDEGYNENITHYEHCHYKSHGVCSLYEIKRYYPDNFNIIEQIIHELNKFNELYLYGGAQSCFEDLQKYYKLDSAANIRKARLDGKYDVYNRKEKKRLAKIKKKKDATLAKIKKDNYISDLEQDLRILNLRILENKMFIESYELNILTLDALIVARNDIILINKPDIDKLTRLEYLTDMFLYKKDQYLKEDSSSVIYYNKLLEEFYLGYIKEDNHAVPYLGLDIPKDKLISNVNRIKDMLLKSIKHLKESLKESELEKFQLQKQIRG